MPDPARRKEKGERREGKRKKSEDIPLSNAFTPHASRLTPHASSATVLAFDFGEKRVGVAVGDTETGLAHALTTITAVDNRSRFAAIDALIREWRPACLVVGLPAHADGSEHEISRLCRRFAQRLEGRFGITTRLVDERFTSLAAEDALRSAGTSGARRRTVIDQVAAQEILQNHLDAERKKTAGGP
jgi:putative Holliday junction resolvase